MEQDLMPVICSGTDTQPSCKHFKAGGCWQHSNLGLDLVIGKVRPRQTAEWMRDRGTIDPGFFERNARPRCGPDAKLFEPRPCAAPEAGAFLEGSTPPK